MHDDAIELLTQLLVALSTSAHENGLRLRALERVAREHPELLPDYERYLQDARGNLGVKKTHEQFASIVERLRKELRRD